MKKYFVSFIFALHTTLFLCAQPDIRGTEFWLTFGRNLHYTYDEVNLQIRIISETQAATGIIYFTHLNDSISFSLAAGNVFAYTLTQTQRQAVYNTTAGITDYSICITSNNPVSVYAFNQHVKSAESTCILPINSLGTNYYYISYPDISNPVASFDGYAVMAIQNNTQVYHNGLLIATLNRGEVYFCVAYDMVGTHIIADKPVALFSTCEAARIFAGATDNLFEQLAPVSTWGTNYFIPVSWKRKDVIRVVASQNGTTISQTGALRIITSEGGKNTLSNLNAGEWVELEISSDSNGCYIQANKPVGICTFLTGGTYYYGFGLSDPAQAWVPNIEQRVESVLITPFIHHDTTAINAHYALIITPTLTKDSTTVQIDMGIKQALSGGKWHDHSSGYSFYDMPLANDTLTYFFTNTAGRLIVMCYGTGYFESYYYLAASAMRNWEADFYVNTIHYQELASEGICKQPVQFRAEVNGKMSTNTGHLKWYIDNIEEIAARDQLSWNKVLPVGTYQIKMLVLYEDNFATQTLEGTLRITSVDIANIHGDTIICMEDTTTLIGTPSSGIWESLNTAIATVDSSGKVTGMMEGKTEIKYIINSKDCADSTSLMITINPIPTIIVDTTILCIGATSQLFPITGGIWESSDSTIASVTNNGLIRGNSIGSATFTFISATSGCSNTTTEVLVKTLPILDVETTPEVCGKENGTITLTVENKEPTTIQYIWEELSDTTAKLTGLKTGTYKVIVSDTFCSVEETIIVEYINAPIAEFEANPQTAAYREEIQFIDKSVQGIGILTNWHWNFGDETDSYLQNPSHRYTTKSGYITILLKIEDEFGCQDSIMHEILLLGNLDFPNVFTPVGKDGKRYVLRPLEEAGYFEEFTMEIFDKWGVLIWQKQCKSSNCPNYDDSFWWNGTNKSGKQVPDGVYYWVVSARYYSSDFKSIVKNGSVTVFSK